MMIWAVEVCQDEEYGCMSLWGVFASKEAAHAAAKEAGLQNTDEGGGWDYRTDYYIVSGWEVK